MPRTKKNEERNYEIKLSDITIDDIESNDCLSIELYISGLDNRMWYLIENFYIFLVIGERKGFSMKLGNSWKGLIQLLLSVLYCKVGAKIVVIHADYENHFVHHVRIDHDFELLKAANISGNPIIEKLYIPPSYRPIYVRSDYTNRNILQALMAICRTLKIDIKKSKVSIKATDNNKRYKDREIENKDDISNLICNIFPSCSNEGIAFVTKDIMKTLLDKYRILVAHPVKTPQEMYKYNQYEWDCTYPFKYLAYPVLKIYERQLIKYFPLCSENIKVYAQKTDKFEYALNFDNYFIELGCDYIITDLISLGKWG